MAQWMVSTHDALSFAVEGRHYQTNEHGMVEVDGADVEAAIQHGFRTASSAEAMMSGSASAKTITPAQIGMMSRDQLVEFLLANDVEEEDLPKKTNELRMMAMSISDEEADAAAGVEEAKEEVETRKARRASKRERLEPKTEAEKAE